MQTPFTAIHVCVKKKDSVRALYEIMGTLSKTHDRFQFQATSGGRDRILYINCDSICNISCCLEEKLHLSQMLDSCFLPTF